MGLIKEPKNVDFYIIDKPWSSSEKKEFSKLIKKLKSNPKKIRPNSQKKSRKKTA